jgi:hypothetical protein
MHGVIMNAVLTLAGVFVQGKMKRQEIYTPNLKAIASVILF